MSIQNTMGIPLSMRLRLAATLSVFLVCSSIATAGPAELLEEIARLEKDAGLSTPAREEALERAVLNLTDVAPTAEVKALVAQMEQRPVRVYVALNEGRARVMVPVYDVASTARVVRQSWVERSAHDLATQLLGSGGGLGEAITDPRGAISPQAWSRGLVAAIDAVPVQQLHMTEAAVAPKVGYSLPADRAALAVAQRLGSAGLFGRILDSGSSDVALDAVSAVVRTFPASAAGDLLERAMLRADIASAAILQSGHLARYSVGMTNSLFARLGDTAQGGSAALALARNMTPTLRFRLSEMAGDESGSLASRRAALALSLAESGALQ